MFECGITPLNLFRLMNMLHLGRFRQSLRKEHVRRKIRGAFISLRDVDWRRTVAYSMGGWGQVYVNLKGREPQGKVCDRDVKELVEKIIEELNELKDPDTGTRIFGSGRIWRKEDIYFGPQILHAPEIVAIPDPPYKTFPDYEFGSNRLITEAYGWSGTHAINGILVAAGPGIRRGFKLNNSRIVDAAPTILYLLGLPIPEDMDGQVLTQMIDDDVLKQNPIKFQTVSTETNQQDYKLDEADEEDLKKTLKGMGYL
jgi:predicted AlkP superfamily phosphohydrolase/phosphomutase